MRKLLFAVSVLIVYGSLYPFNFSLDAYDSSLLPRLFYFGLGRSGGGDIIANVVLFLPFGFFAMQSVKGRIGWNSWLVILGAAFILAHAVQVGQLFVPKRVPSGGDSLLNVLGCALGCLLGMMRTPRMTATPEISAGPLPIPTLLAVFLIIWNLRPFIPSLDLQLLIGNLKHLISYPLPHPVWTLQAVVTWLIIFHFLEVGGVRLIPEKSYPALVLLTLGASFFIVGNSVTIDRIGGALLVLPIWAVLRGLRRPPILVFFTFFLIVGVSFTPFELRGEPSEFSWIPFSGALGGNLFINVLATIKKMLLYGSLIYLLTEMNLRLRVATIIVAAFLFFSEFLQVFFRSHTPEITDSILALMIGTGFYLWENYRRKSEISGVANGHRSSAARGEFTARSSPARHQPPMTEPVQSKPIPAMDGLRAVAALAVFFVHFNQTVKLQAVVGPFDLERFLANGNTGVALFFTLSGLLLSLPFWRANLSTGEFPGIKRYAWRRAARILPAYYFCLFAIIFAMSVAGAGTTWANIFSHIIFAYNFSDRTLLSFNQPFWTLAVEVQFYILLPLLFLALRKTRGAVAFWLILGLVPATYFANFLLVESLRENAVWPLQQVLIWPFSFYLRGPDSSVLIYSTLAHLPHFLMGVVGARVFLALSEDGVTASSLRSRCELIFWLCGLGIFLILSTALDDILQVPLGRYNFPFVPLLLVAIVVCVPFTRIASRLLDLAWVRWLGCISYGIYIYHYPVQKLVSRSMSMADFKAVEYPLIFAIASLAGTLLLARFSYALIEAPVMRRVRQRPGKPGSALDEKETESAGTFERSSLVSDRNLAATEVGTERENESRDILERAAREESGSRRELPLNLRQSQAKFLQHLSVATNLEPSAICQRLVELATRPEAQWHNDLLYSASLHNGSMSYSRAPGNSNWTQVSVYLDDAHFNSLGSLAAGSKASHSQTMRYLLADFMKKSSSTSRRRKRRRSSSKLWGFQRHKIYSTGVAAALGVLGLLALFFFLSNDEPVQIGPHWAGNGASLIFDPHTHTRYSDGKLSPGDLVAMAVQSGCDALVISDHSDKGGTVSDEQMLELQELRDKYPYFLLFNGIELNMPSYGGREHAGLIADPLVETTTLQRIRDLAERGVKRVKNGGAPGLIDEQLLQMIADYQSLSNDLLLVYNHPSRKDADIQENLADLTAWNARSAVFAAIEGAPGHQNAPVIGSYEEPHLTVDRWDPVVAEVGGVWDQWLSQGHQLWGALASSDYHNDNLDKAPCAFSRTHLIVPEESYRGVLRALKTGTFWADHGRILDQLWFSVDVDGMEQAAYPGNIVQVGDRDSMAVVSLSLQRGPGSVGQPLKVEFIGNCSSGEAEILAVQEIVPLDTTASTLVPLAATGEDGSSCSLRARVRLTRASSPDYLAYTNPIRLILN